MSFLSGAVTRCEETIGYTFQNALLCAEALHAFSGFADWQGSFVLIRKNDAIAVLGDTVLRSHICQRWYTSQRSKGKSAVKCLLPAELL